MVLEHLVIFVPIKEISFGLIGLKEITNPGLKCKSDGMINVRFQLLLFDTDRH